MIESFKLNKDLTKNKATLGWKNDSVIKNTLCAIAEEMGSVSSVHIMQPTTDYTHMVFII